jgi:hypothetical protein
MGDDYIIASYTLREYSGCVYRPCEDPKTPRPQDPKRAAEL